MQGIEHVTENLAAALVAFQGAVKAIPKQRTAQIPTKSGGSYRYRYADLSDIWDAIREPLFSNGLAVTQLLTTRTAGTIGIRTRVMHTSGEFDEDTIDIAIAGKSAQEVGSSLTYYKRYALGAALGLATDEDDDGQGATAAEKARERERSEAVKANASARDDLRRFCESNGLDMAAVATRFESDYDVTPRLAAPEVIAGFIDVLRTEHANG